MPDPKKFLDSAGLSQFLTNLKTAYANNANTENPDYSSFAVAQAGKWSAARTVTFATGDVTGSFSIDGSANVSNVALSVADAVASTSGAGGSHGLMTAAQAEKLAGIAAGADENVIEEVQVNGTALTVTNKAVNVVIPAATVTDVQTSTDGSNYATVLNGTVAKIDLSVYALKSQITSVLNFKGTKATADVLPASGNTTGDVWAVSADNSEYVWTGSAWEKLGPTIDLSGYVEKTQKVNNKALSGDITLDGSDIALSSSYAKASSAAAVAAGDSIDTAVGKLEKKVDDAAAAATTYAFAEGSTNGAFQVTPTVGGVAGSAQSVSIHGLGSAAYAATTDFVPESLTPAEAGAQVNDIEVINFKGNGDSSAAPLTITNKAVTIDVSGYALSSQIPQAAASIADGATGYATGDQVYDYVEANKGDENVIEVVKFKGNGAASASALTVDSSDKSVTVDVSAYALTTDLPTQATAIADSDTGYATGDQVYDYIDAMAIPTSYINGLFPATT